MTFTARSETVITFHNFSFACWCSLPSLFLELWTHAFCIFWQSGAKFSLHSWDCPSMVHMVHMFRLFPFPPFAICIHLLFISILISWIFFIFLNHFEPFWVLGMCLAGPRSSMDTTYMAQRWLCAAHAAGCSWGWTLLTPARTPQRLKRCRSYQTSVARCGHIPQIR